MVAAITTNHCDVAARVPPRADITAACLLLLLLLVGS